MIPSLSKGDSPKGLIKYHESKVLKDDARYIGFNNLLSIDAAEGTFKMLCDKNGNISEPTFHVSLNLVPGESVSDDVFMDIANDYMQEMGYREQPYFVVRHLDKEHEHVHIISCRINWNGKVISNSNDMYKSMKTAKYLEIKYDLQIVNHEVNKDKKEVHKIDTERIKNNKGLTKNHISMVTRHLLKEYNFIELKQFEKELNKYNIAVELYQGENKYGKFHEGLIYYLVNEKGERLTKGIAASSIVHKPTLKRLNELFDKGRKIKDDGLRNVKLKLSKVIDGYLFIAHRSIEDIFKRKGFEINYERNSSGIYGISFFDRSNKITYKGSEIGLSWNKIKNKLTDDFNLKVGQELKWVTTQYNYLRKSNLKEYFFEYQMLKGLGKSIHKTMRHMIPDIKAGDHLNPMINEFITEKIDSIEDIKKREYNNFVNGYISFVRPELTEDNLRATVLLNSFYITKSKPDDRGEVTFHHSRSDEFILESKLLDNYKTPSYDIANALFLKCFKSDTRTRNSIRDALISIKTNDYLRMPLEMYFNKKYCYSKSMLMHFFGNSFKIDVFNDLAQKAFLYKSFKKVSESTNNAEKLLLGLAVRGIVINKTYDDKYYISTAKDVKVRFDLSENKLFNTWMKKFDEVDLSDHSILHDIAHKVKDEHIKVYAIDGDIQDGLVLPDETTINELGREYALKSVSVGILKDTPNLDNEFEKFTTDLIEFEEESTKTNKSYISFSGISVMSPFLPDISNELDGGLGNDTYSDEDKKIKRKRRGKKKGQ